MYLPGKNARSNLEAFWLWPVMAIMTDRIGPDHICQIWLPVSDLVPFFKRRPRSYCIKLAWIWSGWPVFVVGSNASGPETSWSASDLDGLFLLLGQTLLVQKQAGLHPIWMAWFCCWVKRFWSRSKLVCIRSGWPVFVVGSNASGPEASWSASDLDGLFLLLGQTLLVQKQAGLHPIWMACFCCWVKRFWSRNKLVCIRSGWPVFVVVSNASGPEASWSASDLDGLFLLLGQTHLVQKQASVQEPSGLLLANTSSMIWIWSGIFIGSFASLSRFHVSVYDIHVQTWFLLL